MQKKRISPQLKQWLYAKGSLTKQLIQLSGGRFSVEPIASQQLRMQHSDAKWLKMPFQHTSLVREVFLYGCDSEPWIKAKSIFPILSLHKKARIFKYLGERPIGHFLFQRTQPLCERRVLYLKEGWTRQSCYTWHGCKFIVQETFLPAFERFISQ